MPVLKNLPLDELERIAGCQGCVYLSQVYTYGCCMYLLRTGKRRLCPAGCGCTVKRTDVKGTPVWKKDPFTYSDKV